MAAPVDFQHPLCSRRTALQAGAIGLLGLGSGEWAALRGAKDQGKPARACIYIFLSGGLSQIDSFDPKPDGPSAFRGEFKPIATRTTGVQVCEHLPRLAQRSGLWSLVRSLTHGTNNHSEGHHMMLTGRTALPPGFNPNQPRATDWPSLAAIAGAVTRPRNNLPPAVVLPERLIHNSGRVIPGQFAGLMGRSRDPWFLEVSKFDPTHYGAYPTYEFDFLKRGTKATRVGFSTPNLNLPEHLTGKRIGDRLTLLRQVDAQRRQLDLAGAETLDRHRQTAAGLLIDPKVRRAFDIAGASARDLDRYGRHSFGWSLLLARRLVEVGVNLVQVNLGNNETWDTHGDIFQRLKENLLPPMDQSVSALLDDLKDSGLLDSTLVVMAGEFGRTPPLQPAAKAYKGPGRHHWGAVQTVFFAGGGIKGGRVVGSSDRNGGHPRTEPQTPETMAATIYQSLGLAKTIAWHDALDRPHHLYHGEPIAGLL
jgi:hypothetical protein